MRSKAFDPKKGPTSSLSKIMGTLPLPPKVAKPPALRVMKPLLAAPPKPSVSKPRPPQPSKPASAKGRISVAGRLGAILPRKPR